MGASGWQHFVPYDADISRALQRLREDVFRSGVFYGKPGAESAPGIEALLEHNGEDGTHSVLDVHRVVDEPLPPSAVKWAADETARTGEAPPQSELHERLVAESAFWGAVAPLTEAQIVEVFATARPSHVVVETNAPKLHAMTLRGCGVYVLVYEAGGGAPREIFFAGVTGD